MNKAEMDAVCLLLALQFEQLMILLILWDSTRREWVRPIFQDRNRFGEQNLVEDLFDDPEMFHKYFRMDDSTFRELLTKVSPYITKQDTNWRPAICPAYRLAITLRFLATGDSQITIGLSYRVGPSTVSLIIKETCEALWKVLSPEVLKPPATSEEWEKISQDFNTSWNFPMCLGAIDGKHVVIEAPSSSGSEYFNYKGTHSIVLMAVCDARYCFTLLDIGDSGRHSDGGVFANSEFGRRFISSDLNMPVSGYLPATDLQVPYCIVGDAAFPLRQNLMRPYPGKLLPFDKSVFNYRLSRARRIIENTFGILVTRWRVFRRPIIASPDKAILITKTACCLHNYLQMKTSYASADVDHEDHAGNIIPGNWRAERQPEEKSGLKRIGRMGSNMPSARASDVRDRFKDYFTSNAGRVPWQDAIVNRTR